jgi:hypothetical protein
MRDGAVITVCPNVLFMLMFIWIRLKFVWIFLTPGVRYVIRRQPVPMLHLNAVDK